MSYSKSRIDRAGEALRRHQGREKPLTVARLAEELLVVETFRAAHARPLTRVSASLRYYVAEASGGSFVVGQRLKRMATIRDKLVRQPEMSLSRMHDIGGCRAVLGTQEGVDGVIRRLREQRRWDILPRTWNYVDEPKADGYRAKHLVVRKDGVRVEVQLRTQLQHAWAELVEQVDRTHGTGLKAGRARDDVGETMVRAASLLAGLDQGRIRLDEIDMVSLVRRLLPDNSSETP